MTNDPELKILSRFWSTTSKISQNAGEEKYIVTLMVTLVNQRDANKLVTEGPIGTRLQDGCFPT